MKNSMTLLLISLIAIFSVFQCSKEHAVQPELQTDPYTEILEINIEIDLLDDMALSDASDQEIGGHLRRALQRLERLINRAIVIVRHSQSDEAKELIRQALDAQHNAIMAAKSGDYEAAFDYVKESAYLAIEAVKLAREEIIERREEIIERLKVESQDVKELLELVAELLDEQEHPRAEKLYKRSCYHFRLAVEELREHHLRKAGFHLKRSKKYAHWALRILNPPEDQ